MDWFVYGLIEELGMDLISIIVPVYNCGQKLNTCLTSLQKQTYINIEVILVNDGSTDESKDICKHFCFEDRRFIYLEHENRGVSFSRNRGIEAASGQYLMFVDGDDDVMPEMIQKYVEKAKETQADVVVGGLLMIEENGNIIRKKPKDAGKIQPKEFWGMVCEDETGVFGYVSNKLYSLQKIKDNNVLFREDMTAQEDLEFALKVYGISKTFYCFDYCGYHYYHSFGKRNMPLRDLVGNQRKLLLLSRIAGVEQDVQACVKKRVQNIAYVALFHASDREQLERLNGIFTVADFSNISEQTFEVKVILWLFMKKKYGMIYFYFRCRSWIKLFLKMNTL